MKKNGFWENQIIKIFLEKNFFVSKFLFFFFSRFFPLCLNVKPIFSEYEEYIRIRYFFCYGPISNDTLFSKRNNNNSRFWYYIIDRWNGYEGFFCSCIRIQKKVGRYVKIKLVTSVPKLERTTTIL